MINPKRTLMAMLFIAAILSCRFPYQPAPFILPEQEYQFASTGEVRDFLGTSNAKLAFCLAENGVYGVCYYDFNDTAKSFQKLKRTTAASGIDENSPLISPDGTFVTFFQLRGNASYGVYIQKLSPDAEPVKIAATGFDPHWWKSPAGEYFIIYSVSKDYFIANLTAGSGKTYKQKVILTGPGSTSGSAEELSPDYPMIGGMSKNGAYLCTGYSTAAFLNLATNELTKLNNLNVPAPVQVCNPSINPDTTHPDWMMFLNFEGIQRMNNPFATSSDYPADAKGSIGQHVVLFIVDITNTVKDFIPLSIMGGGYSEWQVPEWSNKPEFTAALACFNETTADCVIINNVGLRSAQKKTLIINRGKGKFFPTKSNPSLWIGQ